MALVAMTTARMADAQCVDEALRDQLVGRRAYRGVVPRLFKKALRHELSPMGGWYAADAAAGAPVYGGAYTFHVTEDLGLELAYFRNQRHYALLDAIDQRQAGLIQVQETDSVTQQLFLGHLIWSMAYGKVRWFGGAIGRFDFYLSLGAGAIDTERDAYGFAGSGGFGLKLYMTEWLALRIDVRDHVHAQQLPLGVDQVVNDVSVMLGPSLFIPFKS